ncbi:MAG: hypothetical protein IJB54_01345 [Firmicutes bacterium]|nr:hypothetical protein [Bacillota bacterium]
MNNCEGNITAQARELKLKAEVTELKDKLAKMEAVADNLMSENVELTAQNNYLKGQVEAYERVLSHMIYNESNLDDDPCINCEGECEMCGEE